MNINETEMIERGFTRHQLTHELLITLDEQTGKLKITKNDLRLWYLLASISPKKTDLIRVYASNVFIVHSYVQTYMLEGYQNDVVPDLIKIDSKHPYNKATLNGCKLPLYMTRYAYQNGYSL